MENELNITHPDKLLWPEMGITKAIYLDKLASLANYLLPYCKNRYLTTVRYPDGAGGKFFFQKNAPQPMPDYVRTARRDGVNYVHLDRLQTLLWLGNLAALEFHPSFDFIDTGEPSEWLLDIDPGTDDEPRLAEAVCLIGETLDELGVKSVPKTSGASGYQIYVPIRMGYTFAQLRKLGAFIGEYLTEKHPKLFTTERRIKDRGNAIYMDYVQFSPGKSIAAPYTPRGRPYATVSTPLLWEEVRAGSDPRDFNLLTIEKRLAEHGDLLAKIERESLEAILEFIH